MVKFSIIIPVYNVEQYLPRCVESIMAQTFTDFEAFLIDDGSPDRCPELCDLYVKKDNRFKVIHKENGGVSSARNAALSIASGEYIWFVDSDDYVDKDSLQVFYNYVIKKPMDLYIVNTSLNELFIMNLDIFYKKYYFTYIIGFGLGNKLYKRDIIMENGLKFDINEKIGEDLLFNINYYLHIRNIRFIEKHLYYYICREGSAMTTQSKDRHIQQMRLYYKIKKTLKEKVSEEDLCYFFILHLFSGINQSRRGGIKANDYQGYLKDYTQNISLFSNVFEKTLEIFFKNEHASKLGKLRSRIFFVFCKQKLFFLASKIMGLK